MFLFWKDYSVPISENCGRVKVGLDHQKVGHGAVYNLAIGPGVKSWLECRARLFLGLLLPQSENVVGLNFLLPLILSCDNPVFI